MDSTYHYPTELSELLISTIPLLCRSKKSVLQFFKGAGVGEPVISDLETRVNEQRDTIYKYDIVRSVLTRLNEKGEVALRERREVLKRVTEFEDFSVCWEDDRLKAKGLVAEIRHVVNVKDSFTRLRQELEREKQTKQEEHQERIKAIAQKQAEIGRIKSHLFSLFGNLDPQRRGKLLEGILNDLLKASEISIRESFHVVSEGIGTVEQIDGVVEIDGYIYLVEMKWWEKPLGTNEVAPHLVRVFNRGHAGGILISNSAFTDPAINTCKEALTQKIIVLCELQEIVMLLEQNRTLRDFFKEKIQVAVMDKRPFHKPLG